VTVPVSTVLDPFAVYEAGLKEQVTPASVVVQLMLTVSWYPPTGVSVRFAVPVPPAERVTLVGLAVSEKSGSITITADDVEALKSALPA